MTQTQVVNLPPWKLPVWFSKIDDYLQNVIENTSLQTAALRYYLAK